MLTKLLKPLLRLKLTRFATLPVLVLFGSNFVFAACPITVVDSTVYVNDDTSGNGENWATALNDLQAALDLKTVNGCAINQIWVASGTYTPGTNTTDTFQLINGVTIYGGFAAIPDSEGLSGGKFNGNNVRSGTTILNGNSVNCHVVTASSGTTTLKSVTITDGKANDNGCTDEIGGGMYNNNGNPTLTSVTFKNNTATNGGGMYNNNGSPTLTTVTFQSNTATNHGGGMYNTSDSNPSLSNVTFKSNTATNHGGGMYNENRTNSLPEIQRITFKGNEATNGGGMYNGDNSISDIGNVLFSGNLANGNGGGMYNTNITATITQATFSGNKATTNGGGIYNDNSTLTVNNSILWQNEDSDGIDESAQIHNNSSNTTLNFSIIEDLTNSDTTITYGSENIGDNKANDAPLFITAISPGKNGGGDFHLQSSSPALNTGDNGLKSGNKDLGGKTRIIKEIVDRGAYETQAPKVSAINCNTPSDCGDTTPIKDTTVFKYTITFNEKVSGVNITGADSDFDLTTTGSITGASITDITPDSGSNSTYTVTVTIIGGEGTLRLDINDNDSITNTHGIPLGNTGTSNGNFNTSSKNKIYTIDGPPAVTIDQASTQADPTTDTTINFTAVFSDDVRGGNDFVGSDVTISGTAGATTATVTEENPLDGTTYNVAISGMVNDGTVIASINADVTQDSTSNNNKASISTDNEVTYDTTGPTVTINQASAQADPTKYTPINFTVVFSEDVSGNGGDFVNGDITISGTAGATTATVTEENPLDGTTYNVVISGMANDGTVIVNIGADIARDSVSNNNEASTSIDNIVSYDTTSSTPTVDIIDVTPKTTANAVSTITIQFSEVVSGFDIADLSLKRDSGSNLLTNESLTSSDGGINWILDGLSALTDANGTYVLTLTATSSGIKNSHLTDLADGASDTWVKILIAPTGFTATAVSQTQIDLSWTDGNDETSYRIERPAGTTIYTTGADITSQSDTGLTCATTYTYYLIAVNDNGDDSLSATASATTSACPVTPPPSPPPSPPPPPPSPNLTVNFAGDGSGSVTSDASGIDCKASGGKGERSGIGDCKDTFSYAVTVKLTPTADPGSEFSHWSGNNDCASGSLLMLSDTSCTANFKRVFFYATLSVVTKGNGVVNSEPEGISCSNKIKDCSKLYEAYTEITLTATPDSNWLFDNKWQGDCNDAGNVTLDEDKECTATFTPAPSLNLTVVKTGQGTVTSDPIGIDCGADCEEIYDNGTEVTLTAVADAGWKHEGWRGHCSDDPGKVVMLDTDKSCRAVFIEEVVTTEPPPDPNQDPNQINHTLNIVKTGSGTVTSEPAGIDCGVDCDEEYVKDTEITLTATPDAGWIFESWQSDCNNFGHVTLDADKQCTATFAKEDVTDPIEPLGTPFSLQVVKTGEGNVTSQPSGIDCGDDCDEDYDGSSDITLTATPESGWKFYGWRGHCKESGLVNRDKNEKKSCADFCSCRAVFLSDPSSTDGTSDDKTSDDDIVGSGTPTTTTLDDGSVTSQPLACETNCTEPKVKISATPKPGFGIVGWTGGESCNGTGSTLVAAANANCQPVFAPDDDNDGVANSIENAAPNNGDGNGDTIIDSLQNNVVSLQTPNGQYLTTEVNKECTVKGAQLKSGDNLMASPVELELGCAEATITNYQHGINDLTGTPHRQYDSASDQWVDIPVIYDKVTIGGQPVAVEQFTLSDGGLGDSIAGDGKITHTSGRAARAGTVQLSSSTYRVDEFDNVATMTLTRTGGCDGNITVAYATQDGTATSITDYKTNHGALAWADGDCGNKQFAITILDDFGGEGDETVNISLVSASNGAIIGSPNKAILTIADNEANSIATDIVITPSDNIGNSNSSNSTGNSNSSNSNLPIASLSTTVETCETLKMTVGNGDGQLFIKEFPNASLVKVETWNPLGNGEAELTLTGKQVGNTEMLVSDSTSSQQVTLYINVVACSTTTTKPPVTNIAQEVRTLFAIVRVGQSLDFTLTDGNGTHSVNAMPDSSLVSLTGWAPHNDGSANFTLTGRSVGNTKFLVSDNATQQTAIIITVIERQPVTGMEYVGGKLIGGGESIGELQSCKNALRIDIQNNLQDSQACFIGNLNIDTVLQPNHQRLTRKKAKVIRVSAVIKVAPEHVDKAAEFLLVGIHATATGETSYNRNEQTWRVWDKHIYSLPTAQYHPQLPEIVDVFIFEGDLSSMPGEFTVFVGYRLLDDDSIVYNGLEPIHFFVD